MSREEEQERKPKGWEGGGQYVSTRGQQGNKGRFRAGRIVTESSFKDFSGCI